MLRFLKSYGRKFGEYQMAFWCLKELKSFLKYLTENQELQKRATEVLWKGFEYESTWDNLLRKENLNYYSNDYLLCG